MNLGASSKPASAPVLATQASAARWCLMLFWVVVLILPFFYVYAGSAGSAIVNGSLLLTLAAWLFAMGSVWTPSFAAPHSWAFWLVLCVLMLYVAWVPASALLGVVLGDVRLLTRDVVEVHRPVLYILVFMFGTWLGRMPSGMILLQRSLTPLFFLLLAFAILAFISEAKPILDLYTKPANIASARVSAPFVNPYDYAFIMTLFAFVYFGRACLQSIFWSVPALVAVLLVLATQSRSVILGCAIGLTAGYLLLFAVIPGSRIDRFIIPKTFFKYLLFGLLGIALITAAYAWLEARFGYVFGAIYAVIEGRSFGSAQMRWAQIEQAFSVGRLHGLLLWTGLGPAKDVIEFLESSYAFYVFRYGLLGLLLFFMIPWFVGMYCWTLVLRHRWVLRRERGYLAGTWVWWLLVPVSSIGNNFTEQTRVSAIYFLLLGCSVGYLLVGRGSHAEEIP